MLISSQRSRGPGLVLIPASPVPDGEPPARSPHPELDMGDVCRYCSWADGHHSLKKLPAHNRNGQQHAEEST